MSQRTKIAAQLAGVLLVAAGVGGYAYLGVFKKDEAQREKKAIDEQIFKYAATPASDGRAFKTEFTHLRITLEGQTTVLERPIGGRWQMVSPVKADVDPLVIDALTSHLQQAKFKATIEENPTEADLTKYGLAPPQFVVEATAQLANEESTQLTLEGGLENTFDGSIYLRRNGQPAIYSAEGGVRWSLAKSTFDLRKKEVLAVEEPPLASIDVQAKSNAYRLERNADQTWQLVKPVNALTDTNVVQGLIAVLSKEKALSFSPDFSPDAGPLQRVAKVTFTFKDGQTVGLDFTVSRAASDAGTRGYVERTDSHGVTVAEISPSALTNLDRNALDLRDKTIVSFKKEAVAKVVFHQAGGSEFSVEHFASDAGVPTWRVPGLGPAKTFKVTAVIWLLGTLKGSAFAPSTAKEGFGLDGNARFIALFDADGHELGRLTIGREVPNQPNTFYVRGTRSEVIEIDGSRFNELPTSPADVLETVSHAP